MANDSKIVRSTLGIKYPKYRDHHLHTGSLWLKGKQADDGAEGLWRIHDNIYDFSEFIKQHPGGPEWLNLTKGTDITEAFEVHHISGLAENYVGTYFMRKASTSRNSPFMFKEHGFYKTLKKRVREVLSTVPETVVRRSQLFADLLLISYFFSAILASIWKSYVFGALSGVLLSCTAITAHNFFHQRNNFRMYYFHFCLMQCREWRISHVLSHHLHTNTINDLEISALEPFLQYLPIKKHHIFRYLSWVYSPVLYSTIFIGHFMKSIVQKIMDGGRFYYVDLLPFTIPLLMFIVSGDTVRGIIAMYFWIIAVGSLHFGFIGVNAAHHHPDIFHDGDIPRPKEELDWGIHQLDAVMDRTDITGSHFLVLTNFGDHALHHLFPTIDHGKLKYLYPVFYETCREFGVEVRFITSLQMMFGQFRQLAKVKPRAIPPTPLLKTYVRNTT